MNEIRPIMNAIAQPPTRNPISIGRWALALLLWTGIAHALDPITDCTPHANARPICGFTNPEDMVPLPGEQALLVGEYGSTAADHSGGLVLLDLERETRRTVFQGGVRAAIAEAGWGDPSCTTPPGPLFNSHGIDLVRRDDQRLQLLVVQHGDREAIESFEVLGSGRDWSVLWRGCVPAPDNASLNDVAGLSDGRFFTTRIGPIRGGGDYSDGLPTEPTGHAYLWAADTGFRKVEGTDGILPNGIVSSPDGSTIYMNASGENSIRKVDVASGRELGRASVATPDNITWSPDGRLLVASLKGFNAEDFTACGALERGACPIAFEIVAVDPETMTHLGVVYASDGRTMGAGTVGLQIGQELFIGSFKGDRILRVSLALPPED